MFFTPGVGALAIRRFSKMGGMAAAARRLIVLLLLFTI